MGLVSDALGGRLREAVLEERAVEFAHETLVRMRDEIAAAPAGGAGAAAGGVGG